ncbi:hypothetical protein KM043_007296 [Ampulex compressa]|nr:hypothetical protein KM043_007296 [Ampulex compressa]
MKPPRRSTGEPPLRRSCREACERPRGAFLAETPPRLPPKVDASGPERSPAELSARDRSGRARFARNPRPPRAATAIGVPGASIGVSTGPNSTWKGPAGTEA